MKVKNIKYNTGFKKDRTINVVDIGNPDYYFSLDLPDYYEFSQYAHNIGYYIEKKCCINERLLKLNRL